MDMNAMKEYARTSFIRVQDGNKILFYVRKKFALICVGCIAGVAAVGFAGTAMISGALSLINRPDLTEFIKVEVSGFDGYGNATYSVMEKDLAKKVFGVKKDGEFKKKEDAKRCRQLVYQLENAIHVEGSLYELSNGDSIVLTIEGLDEISENLDMKFKNRDSLTIPVSGLKEATAISVGDFLDVDFQGFNGGGCVLLSIKDGLSYPFTLDLRSDYYYDQCYVEVDGRTLSLNATGEEGSLSNGDTYELSAAPNDTVNDYLLENYGMFFNNQASSSKVSGLTEPETLDIFSHVDIAVSGMEGQANLNYHWSELEFSQGNLSVTVPEDDSDYFTVSTKAWVPNSVMGIAEQQSTTEDVNAIEIGRFYIEGDRERDLSSGDVVNVAISIPYDNAKIDADAFADHGLIFSSVSQEITVDSADLCRYVTSEAQVSDAAMKAFAPTLTEEISAALEKDWSRIVHGNSSFTCYDHAITAAPAAQEAYIGIDSSYDNVYSAWIVYSVSVKDSELAAAKPVYVVAKISDLTVNGAGSIVANNGRVEYSFYETLNDVHDARWFKSSDSDLKFFEF